MENLEFGREKQNPEKVPKQESDIIGCQGVIKAQPG